jgi:hypothetical protein
VEVFCCKRGRGALRNVHVRYCPQGFRAKEEEIFCRMIAPNGLVPFVVRECTDYADRRIAVTEPEPNASRYGFVTKLSLGEAKLPP